MTRKEQLWGCLSCLTISSSPEFCPICGKPNMRFVGIKGGEE
jgi:rubrerythrin